MQTKDNKAIDRIGVILLYTAPAVSVGCYCLLTQEAMIDAISGIVPALILSAMYFTFLHVNEGYFYQKISHKMLFFISFFLSFTLLGTAAGFPLGVLWMAAVVIAALDSGLELAVVTHVVLMIQYAFLILPQDNGFYRFFCYILFGMVAAFLFSLFKELNTAFYLALVLLACDGVLQLVVCRFSLAFLKENWITALVETGSVLFLVLTGIFYLKKYGTRQRSPDSGEPFLIAEEAQLKMLTASDYELMLCLKGYSEELLNHSCRIGTLSEQAAGVVGGNKLLAKAGGLYHEIGRMEDKKDYIEAGIRIGKEHNFPERLLAVMRQHSVVFELPESKEAAVVMLSDCIVSAREYLMKSEKQAKLSDEQIVNNIFQNRIKKGNLKSAGMTLEQIRDLWNFYIENAFLE